MSLPVKIRLHIGSGEIDGNGSAHRDRFASGKTGGGGVGLTPLPGVQIQLRLLIDLLAFFVGAEHPGGVDKCVSAEGQNRALIDRSGDGVLYDIQRSGSIHRDVLGAGAVCGLRRLTNGGRLIVRERLLSADGVLTCYGDRVNIVMNNGLHAEDLGIDNSVLTNACFRLRVHIGHGKGGAHADTLAGNRADLVFDGQTVVRSGGGSGGVDLVGGLGIQLQNTAKLHRVLLAGLFQSGEDGLRVRIENRQGKAACYAHIGRARAGDGGGADAVAHILQLTGIAVLGGKLGNGSFQKQIQTDRSHHLLCFQFLTDSGNGVRIFQQSFNQEVRVTEQLRQIGKQTLCQSHCSGDDGAQRLALHIGEHDLEDHILHLLIIAKRSCRTVLIIILSQKLLVRPFLTFEVAQQGFLTRLFQNGTLKNISAGIGIRKVMQKLIDDFVHAAAVCRLQDIGADNEIVRLDGLCAHIGLVLILHIVDCRCRAHTDGAVAGGGVRVDDGVGILKRSHAHIACGLNGYTVRDAGEGLVGMNIHRDGGGDLHAALGGHHAGALTCKARRTLRVHGAVFAGQAAEMACRIAQRSGILFVDLLRFAVGVPGRGFRGIAGTGRIADQVIEIRDVCSRGSRGDGNLGRRACALGTGVDILTYAADRLCRYLYAACLYAAVELRHGRVVQDGKPNCRAYARPAANCLCVGGELADSLGICGDNHSTGHLGHGAVELAHNRLGVHRADRQRHDRCDGGTAGGTGRGLNIEVCLVVRLCFQRAESGTAKVDAVFDLRDCVDVDHFHCDARAHACGAFGHLESGRQGDEHAANRDAVSGTLAGGIGHGGVSAGAGGENLHIAAANVIGGSIAEHCSVIHIGNMHGNCAANAQLGQKPIGSMACLGNGFRGGVQGLGFDAQILRADSALGNACLVAVHQHFDGDCRADGVFRRSLPAQIGTALAQDGRRTIQGAVRSQIGYAAAGGMNQERRGSADTFGRIHFRKVRVVDIRDTQSAHHLIHARPCG